MSLLVRFSLLVLGHRGYFSSLSCGIAYRDWLQSLCGFSFHTFSLLVSTPSPNIRTKALLFMICGDCLRDDMDLILKLIREMRTENMIEFKWLMKDSLNWISEH